MLKWKNESTVYITFFITGSNNLKYVLLEN